MLSSCTIPLLVGPEPRRRARIDGPSAVAPPSRSVTLEIRGVNPGEFLFALTATLNMANRPQAANSEIDRPAACERPTTPPRPRMFLRRCAALAPRGLLLAVLALAAVAVLIRFDVAIMREVRSVPALTDSHSPLNGALTLLRRSAEATALIGVGALVLLFDRNGWYVFRCALLALFVSYCVAQLGKSVIHRERPYCFRDTIQQQPWTASWHGLHFRPFKQPRDAAFPSGHSTAAFALWITLARCYRRGRWLFVLVAVGCASSRFLQNAHWPSDCLAGALIGLTASGLALAVMRNGAARARER